jgi:hypothetical protein
MSRHNPFFRPAPSKYVSPALLACAWSFFDDAMEKAICGSKVRLGLLIFNSCIYTNPRVLQGIVNLAAVRRAAPFRGRCGKAGAVDIQAPYSGARRGQKISQARPKPRRASSFCCGVGPRRDGAPQNACFEGISVNTFCAARRLALPPPRCGNAATLPLREPWMYVVGYNSGVLGPSTHSTTLFSSLRPHIGLFARGSRSERCALCLRPSA